MAHRAVLVNLKEGNMKKISLLILTIHLSGIVYGQRPDPDTTARHFIIMASIGNLHEVNSGKLAAQKASGADVRSFGQMMVTDHSEAEQRLLLLARSRGYDLPDAATDTPPNDLNLSKASGQDFDRLYIHNMVPDHRATVMMFQNYIIVGRDPDLKAFAQQMLPKLREHLAAITRLDEKYKDLSTK